MTPFEIITEQMKVIEDSIKRSSTGEEKMNYKTIKEFVEREADYLIDNHDCHVSPEDGCQTCLDIGSVVHDITSGLNRLEAMMDGCDGEVERQIKS